MTITGPVVPKFFSTTSSSANEPSIPLDGSQFEEGEIFTDLQTGRMWMLGYNGTSAVFRPVLPFVRNSGSPSVVATQVVNDSGMMKVQNAQTSTDGAFNAFGKLNVTTSGATVTSGTYTSNVNEAQLHIVRKATSGSITKGQVVRVVGSTGSHLTVELADASVEGTAKTTIGVAAETITNSADGYMMTSGELTGLSNVPSTSFADGDQLWLSETTGAFTATRPTQPAHGVVIGWVISASNGSNARIFVKVDNGLELNEIHDVLITSATDKDLIQWDSATSLWKNRSLANAGVAAASHTHTASQISDSGATGRSLVQAADAAAGRTALGLGTAATSATGDFAAASHTHTASAISDSTTAGRALLTGADAAAQRTSLGLGTAAQSATGDFAAASHTHSLSNLTQSGATLGQVASWNGTAWTPATSSGSGTVTSVASGTGLSGGPITSTGTLSVDFAPSGTSNTTQVVRADDSRLSNARTPSAHKSTHATGGTDVLTASDIGAASSTLQYVVMTADASLPNERVLTAGNQITVTDGGSSATIEHKWNYRKRATLWSDLNSAGDWTNYSSGTGVTNAFTTASIGDANRFGVLTSATGTTAAGRAGIGSATTDTVVLGSAEHRFYASLKIPTLSTGTQTFAIHLGFNDSQSAVGTDAVMFVGDSNANASWRVQTVSNGTTAGLVSTGVTIDTGWHSFEIVVNAAGTSAAFYIDGTLTNTITANIPTGAARATGVVCGIIKSAGTTASTAYFDALGLDAEVSR